MPYSQHGHSHCHPCWLVIIAVAILVSSYWEITNLPMAVLFGSTVGPGKQLSAHQRPRLTRKALLAQTLGAPLNDHQAKAGLAKQHLSPKRRALPLILYVLHNKRLVNAGAEHAIVAQIPKAPADSIA
jgi:hypothetical protein